MHSCAEVERGSSGQLSAQVPRWRCPTGGSLLARGEEGRRQYSGSLGRCVWRQGKRQPAAPSFLLPEAVARRADCVFSHGLIDIADRLQRLVPKSSAERAVIVRD